MIVRIMRRILLVAVIFSGLTSFALDCDGGNVRVSIDQVEVEGASDVDKVVVQELVHVVKSKTNDICQVPDEMLDRARDVFQQHGYFKAMVEAQTRQIGGTPKKQRLSVILAVKPGAAYRVDHINLTGQTVFRAEQLRPLIPVADSEVFNVEKIRVGITNLRDLYGSRGYIDFTPVPNTEVDDSRFTIAITVDMDEGRPAVLGKLVLLGLEPFAGAGAQLQQAWKPLEGKLYAGDVAEQVF